MPESRGKSLQTIHREFDESLPAKLASAVRRRRERWAEKGEAEIPKRAASSDSEVTESPPSEKQEA